jgi:hypothetical protein
LAFFPCLSAEGIRPFAFGTPALIDRMRRQTPALRKREVTVEIESMIGQLCNVPLAQFSLCGRDAGVF